MSRNSTICLDAIRLVRASGENAVATSVIAMYAPSGHANRGISIVSRSRITSAIQQQAAMAVRICATAMENCSAPATPYTASNPACSIAAWRRGSVAAATVMANVV